MKPRALLAYPAVMALALLGIVVAAGIPIAIGLMLPTHWGSGAMYLVSFFTGCAAAMVGWHVTQRFQLAGGNTLIATVIVGGMVCTLLSLNDVRDAFVPHVTNVDITDIATDKETLVRPLPYTVRAEDVVFTSETIHISKYSRYQCVSIYAMPLCSISQGCKEGYWFAETFVEELGSSDVCADLPAPDWAARANAEWLRAESSPGIYADLVGRDAVVFTPANEPQGTLGDVFAGLRAFLIVVFACISVGYFLETAITASKK